MRHRIVLPSGEVRHIHTLGHPVLNDAGELVEYIGTAMDVTEQHQARTELQKAFNEIRRSEDQLRALINTIPAFVWSARPDGSVDFFNQLYLDYAGLSAEQAIDWGWKRASADSTGNIAGSYSASILCTTNREKSSSGTERTRTLKTEDVPRKPCGPESRI